MILGNYNGYTAKCDHSNLDLYLRDASLEKISKALEDFGRLAFSLYNEEAFLSFNKTSLNLFPKEVGGKLVFELCLYGTVEVSSPKNGTRIKYQPLLLETDIPVTEESSYFEESEGDWQSYTQIREII